MIYIIAQYVHKAIEAATPWLVGTAAGFFVLWLIMLCYKAKPFAKELKWFFSLTPLHKFVVICTVSFFTLWGGSKERGILPSGLIDDISSTMTRVDETIQLFTAQWNSYPQRANGNSTPIPETQIMSEMFYLTPNFRRSNDEEPRDATIVSLDTVNGSAFCTRTCT